MKTKEFTPKDTTKYDHARRLYMDAIPLKEIAKRLGVTPQTLTTWKKRGAWEEYRNALILSPKTLYNKLLKQLNSLIEEGAPRDTADAISKIAKQIKELQRDTTLDDIIEVLSDQSDWIIANGRRLQASDEFLREMTRLQDLYIQAMIAKHTPFDN